MLEDDLLMPVPEEILGASPESRMAVQRLYNVCKQTFAKAAAPFSAQALQRVRSLLDNIKPSDVGLDENNPPQHMNGFFGMINGHKSRESPPISYLHIYQCDDFSMGIFCLPATAVIPLHNHPGMTVLSKLLYGSMHVKAYDWVDQTQSSHPRLARLVVDRVMSASCEPAVLYPTSGGNIHSFRAVTSCAVLDILAPPYSSEDGRHCTYYRELPYSDSGGSLFEMENGNNGRENLPPSVWLEEFQPPSDFSVEGAPYRGPKIAP